MIKILLVAFFSFCASLSYSQEKIWFEDNFNDNSKGWLWSDYDGPEVTRKIANGKYYIEHKSITGEIYWTMVGIYSHPQKDFTIETNILQTEGSDANGYGLIVPANSGKYYYFLINSKKKTYWLGTEMGGTWDFITDWKENKAINSKDNNKLTLKREGDNISFLINDKLVFNSSIIPAFQEMLGAQTYGLVTCTNMKIEVDNFVFRQDNPAINIAPNLPKLTKTNLGANVNTVYAEKTPLISPDGKTLYYTVSADPENIGKDKNDDIWYSTAVNDSTWEKRKHFGFPLNNEWPNSVISVTPDNNNLLLMHTYNADGSGKAAGFSISTRTTEGWSLPVDLKVANYYNKGGSNEFSLSADRKVLMMTIQRDDTYGLNDIYVSFLQENGEFSEPKNLGNTVNTSAWEVSPFLAADGKTLYFATGGHPGYGSTDIFMTKRLDSTWTKWSEPLNMGPDINSSNWEAYYAVPASGKYAYVTSEKNSIGNIDIFRINLPKALRPEPVVLIYGKVLNAKTQKPIQANITYNLLSNNKEVGIASSNPKDGSYKIILPSGEIYSFLAKKDSFYSVSENMDLSALKEYKEIERNLFLAPLEVGETIRLNNLFFDFNKSALRKESIAELARLVKILNDNPAMVIQISGHTDNVGTDEINLKLSEDRALAVKNYLLSKGIQQVRIVSVGYGKTLPVTPNSTEDGRQKNRRVEFTILKN